MVVNDIETWEAEQCCTADAAATAQARTRCLYTRTVDVPAECCVPLRDETGRVTSVVVTREKPSQHSSTRIVEKQPTFYGRLNLACES